MTEARGMLEGLLDFSFHVWATPRMLKFLYGVHLLVGLVASVVWVVLAFQQAPVQGLLALLGALVALFFWTLYCRVVLGCSRPFSAWQRRSRPTEQQESSLKSYREGARSRRLLTDYSLSARF